LKKEQIMDFTRRISQSNRGGLVIVIYDIFFAYMEDTKEAHDNGEWENYKTAFQKKDELLWTPVAVRRIATNIIYTGTLVQGKFTTPNHKVKTKILKPQEKWAVCHNNHEALVSLRTFQIVQRLLSVDMRMAPGKDSIYLLSGIAVCADCGALMTRKVSTVNGKKYVYYMCSNNKKNKKCSSHRIKEADLESRVFDTLRDILHFHPFYGS